MYFRSSGKARRRDHTLAEMEYCGSPDLLLSSNPLAKYYFINKETQAVGNFTGKTFPFANAQTVCGGKGIYPCTI